MPIPYQWLTENKPETTRYRFFYATTEEGDVEVVLNARGAIQIGLLADNDYSSIEAFKLLTDIDFPTVEGKCPCQYKPRRITECLLSAAEDFSPTVREILYPYMQVILRNIKDFVQPYEYVAESGFSRLFEDMPHHQLHLFVRQEETDHTPEEFHRYIFLSRAGLPYVFTQTPQAQYFRTAFAEWLIPEIGLDNKEGKKYLVCVFPSILKAKTLCYLNPPSARTVRVSFAPINPLNPSFVVEQILKPAPFRIVFGANLMVAPFPISAFRDYLKARKIPKPEWVK